LRPACIPNYDFEIQEVITGFATAFFPGSTNWRRPAAADNKSRLHLYPNSDLSDSCSLSGCGSVKDSQGRKTGSECNSDVLRKARNRTGPLLI
jgi:hypothetical protein